MNSEAGWLVLAYRIVQSLHFTRVSYWDIEVELLHLSHDLGLINGETFRQDRLR